VTTPNTALTFNDLVLAVAERLGIAYYGAAGTDAATVPVDTHDLDRCKRLVQDGIRMFIADAPVGGWRWQRPIVDIDIWPTIPAGTNLITGVFGVVTTITAVSDVFTPSMETKTITYGGVGYPILAYVSPKVVTVAGNHACAGVTFTVTADGNYTIPVGFSGEATGGVAVSPRTASPSLLAWTAETALSDLRLANPGATGVTTAVAYQANAVVPSRWDVAVYPVPLVADVLEFPYKVAFNSIGTITDPQPAGYEFDDCIRAACLAKAEIDAEDVPGPLVAYYDQKALPNAYKIDAPKATTRWVGKSKWGRQTRTPPTPERT
jgi:hypothetical protein